MNILLTGANGYIGRRLLPALVSKGHHVYALVRDKKRITIQPSIASQVTLVEADLLGVESLSHLPKDFSAAYYLIHSMSARTGQFENLELTSAQNFSSWIKTTNADQIIYLGGISNAQELSPHLASRKRVEEILKLSQIPVTILRSAIIMGSGSASFEIIRDLVEKLPIMITPKWLRTKCQPIAIRNVIEYLSKVLHLEASFNETYDIGGPEVLTYKEMLTQFAEVRGYKRSILTLPVLTPRLSSYWLYFVTSTSFRLARNLVDSMKNEVTCKDHSIKSLLPMNLINYRESVEMAFHKIEQNMVISSWKDAMASGLMHNQINDFIQVPSFGCFVDQRCIPFKRNTEEVLSNIWSIGGHQGWYYANFLWKIRGFLDKIVGGVGLRRGRRSQTELNPGDALDFWRVLLADKSGKRLLLYAEMKLPGEAWLQFEVIEKDKSKFLRQTATFRPKGILGRFYWYSVMPFHHVIFQNMAENIVKI